MVRGNPATEPRPPAASGPASPHAASAARQDPARSAAHPAERGSDAPHGDGAPGGSTRASGVSGDAAGGAHHAPHGRGGAPGAAAPPPAMPMARGHGEPAGPAGAGPDGEPDEERRGAGYLVETEDVFGPGMMVSPPVIGGDT